MQLIGIDLSLIDFLSWGGTMLLNRSWLFVLFVFLAFVAPIQGMTNSAVRAQDDVRPPAFESPQVEQGKCTFRVFAPNAKKAVLVGADFAAAGFGPVPEMNKIDTGVWEVSLDLPSGAYRYNFVVDGVTTLDSKNPLTSQSNANPWSLLKVEGSELFGTKRVPHGAVAQVVYWSTVLEQNRRMHVYTPPGYQNNTESYPVFYLLHGASDGDDSWTTIGRANDIFDNLISEGKAKPMIVVMPDGHTSKFSWGGGGKRFDQQMTEFENDFNQDVRPYVEGHYRVKLGRRNQAIAGLSMGGAQTLNVAFAELQDFGYVGVFSSGIFGIAGGFNQQPNDQWEQAHLKTLDDDQLKTGLNLLWFGIGSDDFLLETSRSTVKMLKEHKFEVVDLETQGGHDWKN